jgi:hypothetical protein
MFFAIGKCARDLEPYSFTLVVAGSRYWGALRVEWSVKRIANSHRIQCLPTWQYARFLLPTNPTHERNATLPSRGLGTLPCSASPSDRSWASQQGCPPTGIKCA